MEDIKLKLEQIDLPKELDEVINKSIKRARKRKKINIIRNIATFAASFMVLFILVVNSSEALAQTLAKVPLLKPLVELVRYDKGLRQALEKGYAISINKSQYDNGIEFTVDGITFDKRRLVIFYTIETEKKFKYISAKEVKFYDENGKKIEDCFITSFNSPEDKQTNIKQDMIDIHFVEGAKIPSKLIIEIKRFELSLDDLNDKEIINGTWRVDIGLNNSKLMVRAFELNKELEIEDIKVIVKDIKIYPTTCEIKVKFEGENYKAFSLVKPVLIDEKENIYSLYASSFKEDNENEIIYTFESPYFSNVKDLKLKFDGIYFIPKRDQYLIIDIKNKKILDDSGYNIKLVDINTNVVIDGNIKYDLVIEYAIMDKEILENKSKFDFGGINLAHPIDQNGKICNIGGNGYRFSEKEGLMEIIYISKIYPDTNILKFKITRASKGIIKPIEVDIIE